MALLILTPPLTFAKHPDCSGVNRWATTSALVHLKNAKYTNNEKLDSAKTKTTRLASEQIGKDLFRQVHHIAFTERSGNRIEVITVNDASNEECSITGVDIYVVKEKIGGE